jgi:ubiquinone biosynthesis protein
MKISSIPQLYRNLRRGQEIMAVLRRYGLADWFSQLKIDFVRDWFKDEDGVPLSNYTRETRIRMALMDLGPTFIKLGQVLSMRPDLIGSALATELQQLQANVKSDPPAAIRQIIEAEFRKPLEQVFSQFDDEPIASASIGQVHGAKLLDGTAVVVKVQHAYIRAKVREDLEVMAGLATLVERIPEVAPWKPRELVQQLSKSLLRELDFTREVRNLQYFEQALRKNSAFRMPRPFVPLCTPRVITMERLQGSSVIDLPDESSISVEAQQALAIRIAELYMDMIFVLGVYHADPHPGNVMVLSETQLGLIDFGMIGRIDERLRNHIEDMLLAIATHDAVLLTSIIKRVGQAPIQLDDSSLSNDVTEFISFYGSQPLHQFDLGGALNDLTDILHQHHISLPPQTALLIKMLITLEGTLHQLSPNFALLEVMQPFFRKMRMRRLSPKRALLRVRRVYVEMADLLEMLPGQLSNLMQLLQEGKLDVHLAHRGLNPSVNRLVLGMLTSSLFLGSSLLLANKVPPVIFLQEGPLGMERISLLGLFGFVASILVGLRLVRAIYKSGHLDRADSDT